MKDKHDYTWYDISVLDENGVLLFRTSAGIDRASRGMNSRDILDIVRSDYNGGTCKFALGDWEISAVDVDEIYDHDSRAIYAAMNISDNLNDFFDALRGGYSIFVGKSGAAADWWMDQRGDFSFTENFRAAINPPAMGKFLVEKGFLVYGKASAFASGENVYVDFLV